jgi:hypothetical protein
MRLWTFAMITVAACTGKDPYNPGTALGTYTVEAKLLENSCGASVPETWTFSVKLSKESSTLYWVQGGAPVAGQMDATRRVRMTATDTRAIRAKTSMLGACAMTRDDALDLGLAEDEASFTGVLTYGFTPDGDCRDQLEDMGGTFAKLPCTSQFELKATRTALPPKARP